MIRDFNGKAPLSFPSRPNKCLIAVAIGIENGLFSPPLRMGESDLVFTKVHTVEWNPRFAKPATRVEADVETYLHPLRLFEQRLADFHNLLIGQLRLFWRFFSVNFDADDRIRIRVSHTNRFPHNEREKLQFEDGGISSDRLAGSLLKMGTPVHVLDPEPVGELSRSMNSLALQPERDPFPGVFEIGRASCRERV